MKRKVELASQFKSDLARGCRPVRNWLFDFDNQKTKLLLFDLSNNFGAINMKMEGLLLKKNYVLRYWIFLLLLNWIGVHFVYC